MKKAGMMQVAVYLHKNELDHLETIAETLNYPKSKVVRMMLRHFLDQKEPIKYIVEKCFLTLTK